MDAVSLLHLIQGSTYSAAETLPFEGKVQVTSHGNRDEVVMMHLFEVGLPVKV